MAKLAILDHSPQKRVIMADVSDEQVKKLNGEYEGDFDAWFVEEGFEGQLGLDAAHMDYMWLENDNIINAVLK